MITIAGEVIAIIIGGMIIAFVITFMILLHYNYENQKMKRFIKYEKRKKHGKHI